MAGWCKVTRSRGALAAALISSLLPAGLLADTSSSAPATVTDVVVHDLQGHVLNLRELRGRVVLLDVFASWCEPCQVSLPFYAELERRFGASGLTVVAVSVDTDVAALRRFLERARLQLKVYHDPDGSLPARLNLQTMPTLYLVDREGRIRRTHESFRGSDRPQIEQWVQELLK